MSLRGELHSWLWWKHDKFTDWLCYKDWWIARQDFMYAPMEHAWVCRLVRGGHCFEKHQMFPETWYCFYCGKEHEDEE